MKICPTITAYNTHQYRQQLDRISSFAKTIHIDFMDKAFTDVESPGVMQAWWPEKTAVHMHLMYQRPIEVLDLAIKLKPELIIVHAESDNPELSIETIKKDDNVKAGIALLQSTDPASPSTAELIKIVDHVLVFSGNLGHHGGRVDLGLLKKVKIIKNINPKVEIGWDGGINQDNIRQLVDGEVDILNVGGYIQKSEKPEAEYRSLIKSLSLV